MLTNHSTEWEQYIPTFFIWANQIEHEQYCFVQISEIIVNKHPALKFTWDQITLKLLDEYTNLLQQWCVSLLLDSL